MCIHAFLVLQNIFFSIQMFHYTNILHNKIRFVSEFYSTPTGNKQTVYLPERASTFCGVSGANAFSCPAIFAWLERVLVTDLSKSTSSSHMEEALILQNMESHSAFRMLPQDSWLIYTACPTWICYNPSLPGKNVDHKYEIFCGFSDHWTPLIIYLKDKKENLLSFSKRTHRNVWVGLQLLWISRTVNKYMPRKTLPQRHICLTGKYEITWSSSYRLSGKGKHCIFRNASLTVSCIPTTCIFGGSSGHPRWASGGFCFSNYCTVVPPM